MFRRVSRTRTVSDAGFAVEIVGRDTIYYEESGQVISLEGERLVNDGFALYVTSPIRLSDGSTLNDPAEVRRIWSNAINAMESLRIRIQTGPAGDPRVPGPWPRVQGPTEHWLDAGMSRTSPGIVVGDGFQLQLENDGSVLYSEGKRSLRMSSLRITGPGIMVQTSSEALRWSDGALATDNELIRATQRTITAIGLLKLKDDAPKASQAGGKLWSRFFGPRGPKGP
jgi:hypothetical protein